MEISNLTWRSLSAAVNKIQSPSTFLQDLIFKNRIPRDTNIIDIDVIVGNKKLAPLCSPVDGEGKVVSRLGKQSSTVKAPSVRLKTKLPAGMFNEREAGSTIYINKQDKDKAKMAKIAREQKNLKDQIIRRTEWFCSQALKGAINVEQEDAVLNVDFGLPVENKPVLASTAKWNDLTKNAGGTSYKDTVSDPNSNVDDWITLVNQSTGLNATDMILGQNAAKSFKNHPKVKGEIDTENNKGKGSNYIGRYKNLDVWQYSEQYVDDAGVTQNMLDPNACVVIAICDDYELNFGTVEDLDAGGDVSTEFFSKMWKENDPSAYWILVDSHPLPVPKRIEAAVYAIVC